MNYCFNCGTKILDQNQKFCTNCGSNLKERENYRKRDNPKPGESYNDYLKRINSPMKDDIATEEEIEKEKEAYINYDPLKSYKENHPKINYPEDHSSQETNEEEVTYPYKREVISEGMFGAPAVSIQGNFVYEGMYGRPKYYIDGDIIRENNQFGRPAYRIDGKYIREGMFGKPKYYIDGDLIKENNQFGKVVGRRRK